MRKQYRTSEVGLLPSTPNRSPQCLKVQDGPVLCNLLAYKAYGLLLGSSFGLPWHSDSGSPFKQIPHHWTLSYSRIAEDEMRQCLEQAANLISSPRQNSKSGSLHEVLWNSPWCQQAHSLEESPKL